MQGLLDVLDRLVHFEGFGNRNAALGAESVLLQANIRGGNTIRNDRNVVTAAIILLPRR